MGAGGIYETYTTGIAVFVHRNDRAEVAHGNFYRQRKQCVHDLARVWYFLLSNEGNHDNEVEIMAGQQCDMCEQARNCPHRIGSNHGCGQSLQIGRGHLAIKAGVDV